ncbi:MAG: anti-sigma F factor [Eubacteriales bacterium]
MKNEMELIFDANSTNEGFARVAVAAFTTNLNPTLEEIADIKTAVSEAVTNAIIHGYDGLRDGKIKIKCSTDKEVLDLYIVDQGCGISNVKQAMEPLYTTKSDMERSGMGFAFMEAFMDELSVETQVGSGTTIHMRKQIGRDSWSESEE